MNPTSSISHELKKARLERNLSIEALSKETKITPDYIKAIESGNFKTFPANVYLKGFVQNLCEALGVDSERLADSAGAQISAHGLASASMDSTTSTKAFTDDTPSTSEPKTFEGNYPSRSQPSTVKSMLTSKLLWTLGLACVLLGGVFVAMPYLRKRPQVIAIPNPHIPHVHDMFQQAGRYTLKRNDAVHILDDSIGMHFTMLAVAPNSIEFSVGEVFATNMQLHERLFLDLSQNENNDLEVELQRIEDHGATLYLNVLNYEATSIDYTKILSNTEPIVVGKEYTLFEYTEKTPIQVYIQAKALPSIINYNKDGKRQDTINIEPSEKILIKADEHLEVIFGNYKSLLVMINQKPIDLTLPENTKASITKIIKWIADPNNETKYNLVVKDYVH